MDRCKVHWFHKLREQPKLIRCIKDSVCRNGFGKTIKAGQKVLCSGLVAGAATYEVAVPDECGFYDYNDFEMIDYNF